MKEPEDCMVAAREASALMGSAGTGDAQAASSGKAGGGGGKGGDGGALLLLPPLLLLLLQGRPGGAGGQAPASCSKRTWFCSC